MPQVLVLNVKCWKTLQRLNDETKKKFHIWDMSKQSNLLFSTLFFIHNIKCKTQYGSATWSHRFFLWISAATSHFSWSLESRSWGMKSSPLFKYCLKFSYKQLIRVKWNINHKFIDLFITISSRRQVKKMSEKSRADCSSKIWETCFLIQVCWKIFGIIFLEVGYSMLGLLSS